MAYAITLPHDHVRRMRDRNATVLILTHRKRVGNRPAIFEIHDSRVVRRNTQYCHDGRPDLQGDPKMLTIEILTVEKMHLGDVDLRLARDAGYGCGVYDEEGRRL